jgi:hypothetical protein
MEGETYLLFLKHSGLFYDLVHPFQGGYIKNRLYSVYDAQISESPNGTKMDFDDISERIRVLCAEGANE